MRTVGRDVLRVADRWAETEEFVEHVRPPANEDSALRLFEELGGVHTALRAVRAPGPSEPLDDHRTLRQLRHSVGFTRRRLGPGSEPVVRRLIGGLAVLRATVELPPRYTGTTAGATVTFDLDFARVREGCTTSRPVSTMWRRAA